MKVSQKRLWPSENGSGKHLGMEKGRIIGERIRFEGVNVLLDKSPTCFGQSWSGIKLSTGGTQREYSSKLLKHSIVKRILVFKR